MSDRGSNIPIGISARRRPKTRTFKADAVNKMAAHARTIDAMREALEDEYRARATYTKVIEVFGPVRPFVNIVEAEDRHAKALLDLFAGLGIEPPQDRWSGRTEIPDTLAECCAAAIAAEIENQAMYERLIAAIDEPAVATVMRRLQRASQERHLPAFRRCLEREAAKQGSERPTAIPRVRLRRRGSGIR